MKSKFSWRFSAANWDVRGPHAPTIAREHSTCCGGRLTRVKVVG